MLRLASWAAEFGGAGPGLLLNAILKRDKQMLAQARALADTCPDILALTDFDYDARGAALHALSELLTELGCALPVHLPLRPNSGIPTDLDLDGDGATSGPADAQAFGRFPGDAGLALLAAKGFQFGAARSFTEVKWATIPDTLLRPEDPGWDRRRLSSGGHYVVPLTTPGGVSLLILLGRAAPPLFGGASKINERRNRDELRLWSQMLTGNLGPPISGPMVFMAHTNLDPQHGKGRREAMAQFLSSGSWQDPLAGQPTANWPSVGSLRVAYILPSREFTLRAAHMREAIEGTPHRILTVDVAIDPPLQP